MVHFILTTSDVCLVLTLSTGQHKVENIELFLFWSILFEILILTLLQLVPHKSNGTE